MALVRLTAQEALVAAANRRSADFIGSVSPTSKVLYGKSLAVTGPSDARDMCSWLQEELGRRAGNEHATWRVRARFWQTVLIDFVMLYLCDSQSVANRRAAFDREVAALRLDANELRKFDEVVDALNRKLYKRSFVRKLFACRDLAEMLTMARTGGRGAPL